MSKRLKILSALLAAAALATTTAVLASHNGSTGSAHAAKFVRGVTPLRTYRIGNSTYSEYGRSTPRPQAARRAHRRVSAHVARAEQDAMFPVLARPQTAAEAADPVLKLIAAHEAQADLSRARALDGQHTYWLLPTHDGQVCLGHKTTGVQVFGEVCGYDDVVAKTGLTARIGDSVFAVLPDGTRDVRDSGGQPLTMANNLVLVPGSTATFVLDGVRHTIHG